MTVMVRDEIDIIDTQIRYHLEAGVDHVIAMDHRSSDGTNEILRRYERDGVLRLLRQTGETYLQGPWVTEMARLAAAELGADWVINSDADEFWWPHHGSLREVLAAVPPRFGAIRGIWRHFALRPESDEPFFERMTVRRRPSLDSTNPYCANAKVMHRGDADVTVAPGNHDATGRNLDLSREWTPFEILHFPIRSRAHLLRKYRVGRENRKQFPQLLPLHVIAMDDKMNVDPDRVYRDLVVEDAGVAQGVADGALTVDTRLRDWLRGTGERGAPSLADDAAFAEEVDVSLAFDSMQRLKTRVQAFEDRLGAVESRRRVRAER
jgi:hypothetical protein